MITIKNILSTALVMITITSIGQIPSQTLPEFEFSRPDKSPFTNKDLAPHKLLVFIFFDSECDHCQHAIKNIDQQYKSFEKTAVYLVSLNDPDKINNFMSTYGPKLKTQKNVLLLHDRLNQFIAKFQPKRYPAMFVYSSEKKLLDYEDNEESVFRLVNTINRNNK